MHLCYTITNLPPKPVPQRKIKHADKGYGAVFLNNDRKISTDGKTIRLHEICGDNYQLRRHALNRVLALEFCKSAGIEPLLSVTSVDGLPEDDLNDKDRIRLCNEERMLERAHTWLSSAGGGFWEVPAQNDMLRVSGAYEQFKQQAGK
jgi:hypothetical protein